MRYISLAFLTITLLIGSVLSVAAQTYFPFGSVAIGTSSTSVRVGPIGCVVSASDPTTFAATQVHPLSCRTDGALRIGGSINVEPGVSDLHVIIDGSTDLNMNVLNGSVSVIEDRNIPASTPNVAQTATVLYGFNGSTNVGYWADPCNTEDKTTTPISVTADTVIVPATSGKRNYVCSIDIVASAAEIVSVTEGTGSVCGTGEAAIVGSTTDANGMSLAANGIITKGNGNATVYAGKTANVDTCLNVSGANRVSGAVTWVQR